MISLDLVVRLDWVVVMNLELNGLIRLDGYDELKSSVFDVAASGAAVFCWQYSQKAIYLKFKVLKSNAFGVF
jgi:hypothetical protein